MSGFLGPPKPQRGVGASRTGISSRVPGDCLEIDAILLWFCSVAGRIVPKADSPQFTGDRTIPKRTISTGAHSQKLNETDNTTTGLLSSGLKT